MAKSFYIIDGHAQIFRAFFAPFRELTSPSGEPTKATFVFIQMLLNLIANRKPDYLAMAVDTGGKATFREEILPEYKANRAEAPSDFAPQEQRILRMVKDAGIPLFAIPGYEADDIIATVAHRLCDRGYEVVLVSKDKDLRQLINGCTKMYDVQADAFLDAAGVEREYGYAPAKAVEVQTLTGDSTDNIAGIPGVGEKNAAKLIAKYGTADAVLQHLDELTPKMRENFEKYGERLSRNRKLVALRTDVPMDFDPEACRFRGLNAPALRRHLEELGFTTLVRRYGLDAEAPAAATESPSPKPPPALRGKPLRPPRRRKTRR